LLKCFSSVFMKKVEREMMESKTRSILKSVSWRVLATCTTMLLVYLFTKRLTLSLGIGAVEVTVKMFIYFLHERMWLRIKLGIPE
jgi:adenylylsulfate kinase